MVAKHIKIHLFFRFLVRWLIMFIIISTFLSNHMTANLFGVLMIVLTVLAGSLSVYSYKLHLEALTEIKMNFAAYPVKIITPETLGSKYIPLSDDQSLLMKKVNLYNQLLKFHTTYLYFPDPHNTTEGYEFEVASY